LHLLVPPGGSFRETRRIELGPRVLTIGRAATCDVRIDVPGVDEEHAKLSEIALIAVGPDCAVGDVPLDAGHRRLVMPGDEIQIGSVVISLEGSDPSLHEGERRQHAMVRVVEGKNFGDELVLSAENREYVIGRNPKADLVLDDREVSREHIKLVRRGAEVYIFDAASTRGSWLGRMSVFQGTKTLWERPRMLKLGATVLALELPEGAARKGPAAPVNNPMTPPPRQRPADKVQHFAPAPETPGTKANFVAYHYEAKPQPQQRQQAGPDPVQGLHAAPSVPPPQRHSRTAWKKTGPRIGRAQGLLLLAVAGIAILGALFVVFSLME
jgi:hypothetical protein